MAGLIAKGVGFQSATISAAGERATYRFTEFFTAQIRNPHTRRAYGKAVGDFLGWIEALQIPTKPATDSDLKSATLALLKVLF